MKYMLLMNHTPTAGVPQLAEWSPQDIKASGEAMMAIHQELTGPEAAKIVTHDGVGAPIVTDGPFPESKEFLAGYWFIDVESPERAIEIAARTSAAPGPGGRATAREIQVRPVMSPPDMEM